MRLTSLHEKDLSEVSDIGTVLQNLNSYLHSTCLSMDSETRLSFSIVRSRSSSVASFLETLMPLLCPHIIT